MAIQRTMHTRMEDKYSIVMCLVVHVRLDVCNVKVQWKSIFILFNQY